MVRLSLVRRGYVGLGKGYGLWFIFGILKFTKI